MSTLTPQKYKVAINCLVYNHEPYLRDCLEGFVMQQTDFPFVAIVHDGASTDRSADIIREYAAKLFAITPVWQTTSIKQCMDKLVNSEVYDSCFTTLENHGFYWLNNTPINYRPYILPRNQDMLSAIEETTGLYGMMHEAFF